MQWNLKKKATQLFFVYPTDLQLTSSVKHNWMEFRSVPIHWYNGSKKPSLIIAVRRDHPTWFSETVSETCETTYFTRNASFLSNSRNIAYLFPQNTNQLNLWRFWPVSCSKLYRFRQILVSCNKCLKARMQTRAISSKATLVV